MSFLDPRLPARFWRKCIPEPNSGCWLWLGNANQNGYGRVSMSRGTRGRGGKTTMVCAHRLAYERLVGPVPTGLELDHLCRNRGCCNPLHLEPVTHRVNSLRGTSAAAINAVKTHCPKGHEYVQANVYSPPCRPTMRQCRICSAARKREYEIRKRERHMEAVRMVSVATD